MGLADLQKKTPTIIGLFTNTEQELDQKSHNCRTFHTISSGGNFHNYTISFCSCDDETYKEPSAIISEPF